MVETVTHERGELERLCRLWGFGPEARVGPLAQSENTVYLIEEPDVARRHVMRISSGRLAYHTAPSIASEMQWLESLGGQGALRVPEVRATLDGARVVPVGGEHAGPGPHAVVYTFLEGEAPSEEALEPGFEQLGRLSALMHRHAMQWRPPADFHRHHWTPVTILDDALGWGPWQQGAGIDAAAHSLLQRLEHTLRRRLGALPRGRDVFGLIHADLRLANLLVDGAGTAIIDFDDCGLGWYLYDLAGALSFLEERPDAPLLVDRWLSGYREVLAIDPAVEAELPGLIMLRRLQLLGWVGYQRHCIDFARDIALDFTRDTCRLAEDYLRRHG